MKVKELIELLQKEDPEREVILQKDSEGNGYSPLYEIGTGTYKPESTYHGEFVSDEDGDLKALVLCPTN